MQSALAWTPAPATPLVQNTPYWEAPADQPNSARPPRRPPLKLAYIGYGSANPYELASDLRELSKREINDVHVMVAREALEAASLSEAALVASGIAVHRTGWIEPTAAEIQSVISDLTAEAVAFLPAGMSIEGELWTLAASQLAASPEAAIFTSHVLVTNESATRRVMLNYGGRSDRCADERSCGPQGERLPARRAA